MRFLNQLLIAGVMLSTMACRASEEQCIAAADNSVELAVKNLKESNPNMTEEAIAAGRAKAKTTHASFVKKCRGVTPAIAECFANAKSTTEQKECPKAK